MTLDKAIERYTSNAEYERTHGNLQGCLDFRQLAEWLKDYERLLEREPCNTHTCMVVKAYMNEWDLPNNSDAISRQAVLDCLTATKLKKFDFILHAREEIKKLPSVTPQEPKTGHCKDCKYFEYDSVSKVDGIPLILAHEICSRWGDGCKTKEDGYCFLFEPRERSGEE